jgi:hypothetical protein
LTANGVDPHDQRKSVPEMWGESLREGGILVLVFGGVIHSKDQDLKGIAWVVVFGMFLLVAGFVVERWRKS